MKGADRRRVRGAEAMHVDGIKFQSKREGRRYMSLKLLERAGRISDLELQPKYPLEWDGKPVKIRSKGVPNGRRSNYRADFRYYDRDRKQIVVEDAKGYDTDYARLKRAIVECIYGIQIELV